jgi:integrase
MKTTPSRKPAWPKHIAFGNVTVTVYKRTTPNGNKGFMLAYMQDGKDGKKGKRKFDSYTDEAEAILEAEKKARQLSTLGVKAAQLTDEELRECVTAMDAAKPLGISLTDTVYKMAEAVKIAGDVSTVLEACKFYVARHKKTIQKPVAEVVEEMLAVRKTSGASQRYLQDLRLRLNRFAAAFPKSACNVTTSDIQAWLDGMKLSWRNSINYRTVVHTLFKFAVARGYAVDNPVSKVEKIKPRGIEIEIFTPVEITRLLAAAPANFVPCLAIGAFAGLRSAEIERLEWSDIDLKGGHITIGAKKAKTATRRTVPIAENLVVWLSPYSERKGEIWPGTHDEFYECQQETAAATVIHANSKKGIAAKPAIRWKANGLRHSYASYRFALTNDAGRVAGELGNTAAIVHRHYRELVKPEEAKKWFAVKPEQASNVIALTAINSK